MQRIKTKQELKAALAARETELVITNKALAQKVWVAYKVKKYWSVFASVLGIGTAATLATGPLGFAAMTAAVTPIATTVAISTGVQVALIIAAVSIIAMMLNYNVEIVYCNKDGNLTLRYKK